MDQRKLYKTIETISSGNFASDKEMLIEVLNQIIEYIYGHSLMVTCKIKTVYCGKIKKMPLIYQSNNC